MKSFIRKSATPIGAIVAAFILLTVVMAVGVINRAGAVNSGQQNGRLITIHDGSTEKVILTTDKTIGDALKQAGIHLDSNDLVEPATSQKLIAPDYSVNIYRAHPVIVIDGASVQKIITPYQTADQIAQSAGITLYPEDTTTLSTTSNNIVSEGAGLELTIHPATAFSFTLYDQTTTARTQAKTVGGMLKEKGITLGANGRVSPDQSTPITSGMTIRVWREGTQTITVNQPIPFTTQKIQDGDYNVGYQAIQTPGVNGNSSVTYQVTIQNGQEVSRTEIASIVTVQPVQQVEIVGVKVALSGGYSAEQGTIMIEAGIAPSDQAYAAYIVDHENSLWCPTRWQGQSGCPASYDPLYSPDAAIGYGLCQATPGDKMASAGSDWETNPVTQMEWCSSYAVSKYGSWYAAYIFKVENGWW